MLKGNLLKFKNLLFQSCLHHKTLSLNTDDLWRSALKVARRQQSNVANCRRADADSGSTVPPALTVLSV